MGVCSLCVIDMVGCRPPSATGPASFYVLRLALGVAEAGAFPAMWHVCGQVSHHMLHLAERHQWYLVAGPRLTLHCSSRATPAHPQAA